MPHSIYRYLLCVAMVAVLVKGQTETVLDAAGETVIEVITLDPLGLPTTTIISTVSDTSTSTTVSTSSTSTTSTTTPLQQGPVGQPPATTVAGETVYEYTTTDALGNQEVLTDTFTPTYQPATTLPITLTGTVLSYSDWLAMVGTNTVAAQKISAGTVQWKMPSSAFVFGPSLAAGMLGGAWLVFA